MTLGDYEEILNTKDFLREARSKTGVEWIAKIIEKQCETVQERKRKREKAKRKLRENSFHWRMIILLNNTSEYLHPIYSVEIMTIIE